MLTINVLCNEVKHCDIIHVSQTISKLCLLDIWYTSIHFIDNKTRKTKEWLCELNSIAEKNET